MDKVITDGATHGSSGDGKDLEFGNTGFQLDTGANAGTITFPNTQTELDQLMGRVRQLHGSIQSGTIRPEQACLALTEILEVVISGLSTLRQG